MRRLFLFLIFATAFVGGCGGGHKPPSVETLPPAPTTKVESGPIVGWWWVTITSHTTPSRIEVIREGVTLFNFLETREVKIDLPEGNYLIRVIYPDGGSWEGELTLPPK